MRPLWFLMGPYESLFVPKDFNGSVWVCISPYVSLWIPIDPYGSL